MGFGNRVATFSAAMGAVAVVAVGPGAVGPGAVGPAAVGPGLAGAVLAAEFVSEASVRAAPAPEYGVLPLHFEANRGQTDARVKFFKRDGLFSLFLTPGEAVLVLRRPGPAAAVTREAVTREAVTREAATRREDGARRGWRAAAVRMKLDGADPDVRIVGLERLPGKSNYLTGHDPSRWKTGIPHYAKVKYVQVYPGVDLIYYGNPQELEFDLVLAPEADPSAIALVYEGAESLALDAAGNLVIETAVGRVLQRAPVAYQEIDGRRREVGSRYLLTAPDRVEFQVAAYDRALPLVIDPTLDYSTLLGGNSGGSAADNINDIAVDGAGAAYVTGFTAATNFPTTAGVLSDVPHAGSNDVFVTKLDPTGSFLVYSTFLGGATGAFIGEGIAVDGAGNAVVTGQANPFSDLFVSDNAVDDAVGVTDHPFVSMLNADGTAFLYSTFLSGNGGGVAHAVAVDGAGLIHATGRMDALDFPTKNAFQAARSGSSDVYYAKIDPNAPADPDPLVEGESLVYSTYLGGDVGDIGDSIAVTSLGHAVVTGLTKSTNPNLTLFPTKNAIQPSPGSDFLWDAFVAMFDPSASGANSLVFSTFLGGGSDENVGFGQGGIGVDAADNIYVTGATNSIDFPTTAGAFEEVAPGLGDAFVTKLSPDGQTFLYSTYLGGSFIDAGTDLAVDADGNAYVTGSAASADFPVQDAFQPFKTNSGDAFVAVLDPTGSSLVYSTFLGGGDNEDPSGIAVDGLGAAYAAGSTGKHAFTPFPTTAGAFQELHSDATGSFQDGYITKFPPANAAPDAVGGALGGVFVAFAACLNVTTNQFVPATPSPGVFSWDCEAAGLTVISGDTVAAIGIGPAVPALGSVGGSMSGAAPFGALCDNLTQAQQVIVPVTAPDTSWDCEAEGLLVNPGDLVRVIGVGLAN